MIGARVGVRVGPRVGAAVGVSADEIAHTASSDPPEFVDAGDVTSGTGQVTPDMPDHEEGDILLLAYETQGSSTSLNTANGFVEVDDSPQVCSSGTLLTSLHLYWKRAESSSDDAPIIGAPSNHTVAVIFSIRGCVAEDDPWDVTAGDVTTVDSDLVSFPNDTTTVDNCLVLCIIAHGIDAATGQISSLLGSNLTDVTERVDVAAVDGNGGGIGVVSGVLASAGEIGNLAAALAAASGQALITIALKPA